MNRLRRIVIAILLLCVLPVHFGCATRNVVRPATAASATDPLSLLRSDLDRIFDDSNFADAQWGVEILSLDRSEPIYERNATRLYMPASNNKLLTTSAALIRLGPDFRYETRLLTDGAIQGQTLEGNLIVQGSGDPSSAPGFHGADCFRMFRQWASELKDKGIRKIDGDLIGDEGAFEADMLGNGWEWDDLAYGYAAPVSALQFNENVQKVVISPAEKEGEIAAVSVQPLDKYFALENRIVTTAPAHEPAVDMAWGEGREHLVLKGSVPLKGAPQTRTVAVQSPTIFYLAALKLVLAQEGIDVSRCAVKAARNWDRPALQLLWVHASPPLTEIMIPLLKLSQNLYAETLTRTLGLKFHGLGSFSLGKEVVEDALHEMAIQKGTYHYADGSGLSRLNLVTADLLVRIFNFMYRHPNFRQFYDSLPIAGEDGTIAGRMKGTRAEGNAHAKTGSIAYVRSLSGYVRTADNEMLAFAMIANNFLVTRTMAEYVQDSAVVRLATFTRK